MNLTQAQFDALEYLIETSVRRALSHHMRQRHAGGADLSGANIEYERARALAMAELCGGASFTDGRKAR